MTRVVAQKKAAPGEAGAAFSFGEAVADYLNGGQWELIQEFVEVESGKG